MTALRLRRLQAAAALATLVAVAACSPLWPPAPGGDGREPGKAPRFEGPPPVTIRAGGRHFELQAWSYCFGNACVDGIPPADLPDVGAAPQVQVAFPLEGWTFEATFVPVGEACPRRHTVPVPRTGDTSYVVQPAGHADTYDVTLFGRGGGDLAVTFRWTTPRDGPMPVPNARLAVLALHDGAVDSYGIELMLADLAATPEDATAEVTVTAANGQSLTFEAVRAGGCFAEGTAFWDGPDEAGLEAVGLGPAPFTYDVIVALDGRRYSATATWPADEIDGNEPSVALDFAPPLPALR